MHSSGDGANGVTVVAAAAVGPVRVARTEEQVAGEARVRRVLRGRPVVAARAGTAEVGAVAVARCWQEDATAVGPSEQPPVNTVSGCPSRSTVAYQLVLLLI